MKRNPTIVLSSGEMSGDMHAAQLTGQLLARMPECKVQAMAGDLTATAGATLRFHYRDYAIIGFTAVLANLPRLMRLERGMKRAIDDADLFIAVDYPGLNLRLAEYAHKRGVPVLYYISPQLWAWNPGRIAKVKKYVDHMAVVFPFEVPLYAKHQVPVDFVGHPLLVDHHMPSAQPQEERSGVGILPGSRVGEVKRVLPVMLAAAKRMRAARPELTFTIGRSVTVAKRFYDEAIKAADFSCDVVDVATDVMRRSRALMVASGTATLESALYETPLVIVYRVSAINYALARRLIKIRDIGLVNVVLGKRVAPEFVQHDARPDDIAATCLHYHDDTPERVAMVEQFRTLRDTLSGGDGTQRVAEIAEELLAR